MNKKLVADRHPLPATHCHDWKAASNCASASTSVCITTNRKEEPMLSRFQVDALRAARWLVVAALGTISPAAWTQVDVQVGPGWTMIGNGYYGSVNVASIAPAGPVTTVWKWLSASGKWAFFTPTMTSAALASYAASKGYDVLATINPGEGFWINASAGLTLHLHANTPPAIPTAAFQAGSLALPSGWSLIAVGGSPTPREFANGIADTAPSLPDVAANTVTTLWAWGSGNSGWYFYSPSLDNQGHDALPTYASSKGYLEFFSQQKLLGPTTGFWVNKP